MHAIARNHDDRLASGALRERYRFGRFELDVPSLELRRDGCLLVLSGRPLQSLIHLIRHRDRVVKRDELLREVWCGVRVASGSLSQAIWDLRRGLGDDSERIIKTTRGHGYRFVAQVVEGARDASRVHALTPAALIDRLQALAPSDLLAVQAFIDALPTAVDAGGRRLDVAS